MMYFWWMKVRRGLTKSGIVEMNFGGKRIEA
jgi:hypothetical protein